MSKRPLIEAVLDEPKPRHWINGRFTVTRIIAPYGRPRSGAYPESVTLHFRLGDDRVSTAYDLTWDDAERLHAELGRALQDRKRFKVAVNKAKDRRIGFG
jgi:hypothetical protein